MYTKIPKVNMHEMCTVSTENLDFIRYSLLCTFIPPLQCFFFPNLRNILL